MKKVIKIKQKDIENIVSNLINEREGFDELESDENLSEPYLDRKNIDTADEIENSPLVHTPEGATDSVPNPLSIAGISIFQGQDGGIYAINARTGEVYERLK